MALITVERARRAFAPRAWTDADNAELAQAVGTAYQLAMNPEACQRKSALATEFAARHQGAVARCLQLMQALI